jgi:hypothetical protein
MIKLYNVTHPENNKRNQNFVSGLFILKEACIVITQQIRKPVQ